MDKELSKEFLEYLKEFLRKAVKLSENDRRVLKESCEYNWKSS